MRLERYRNTLSCAKTVQPMKTCEWLQFLSDGLFSLLCTRSERQNFVLIIRTDVAYAS
jgi:hypothetical protein